MHDCCIAKMSDRIGNRTKLSGGKNLRQCRFRHTSSFAKATLPDASQDLDKALFNP
jgi:hypothetical protein